MRRFVRIVLGLLTFGVAAAVAPIATPVSATETHLGLDPHAWRRTPSVPQGREVR